MGDFFKSPRERASRSLYDAAVSGHPIGADFLDRSTGLARQSLREETSRRLSGMSGDILSRAASAGVSPGSSTEGLISKATEPVLAGEQQAEAQLSIEQQRALANMILQQLGVGLSGMSSSSTFGDIMAGITTTGNIFGGIGTAFPQWLTKGTSKVAGSTGNDNNTYRSSSGALIA